MENNKVLMTGASGYLGSNLLKSLLTNGYEVSILKRKGSDLVRLIAVNDQIKIFDIDEVSLDSILEKSNPGIVIHCATDYGRKNTDPSLIASANLILPLKLLYFCKKNKVNCFINTDTFLDKKTNAYSLSKYQFKEWLRTYSTELICVNMTLEHFYGPYDDKSKFVSMLIDKFLSSTPEIDLTAGEQQRDFIYISDLTDAFIAVLKNITNLPKGFYNYDVGTNQPIKIRELAELIKSLSGNNFTNLIFGAIPYRENELMESNIDTTAIRALGWTPKCLLKDGLQKTINAEKEKRQ